MADLGGRIQKIETRRGRRVPVAGERADLGGFLAAAYAAWDGPGEPPVAWLEARYLVYLRDYWAAWRRAAGDDGQAGRWS